MIIAFVGAGGKTTLGNHMGNRLAGMERRVLFTTTTKILRPSDNPLFLGAAEDVCLLSPFMTAAEGILASGKLEGYSPKDISVVAALDLFDDIIVEADGAARRPVKAPNETEPVYPPFVDLVIGVIGLDCIGQPVNDQHVHRPALFSRITGATPGKPVTPQHIIELISHPEGLFRHAPTGVLRVVFLNKYDKIDKKVRLQAENITRQSPYPVILAGYNIDWFGTFAHRFFKGDCYAH